MVPRYYMKRTYCDAVQRAGGSPVLIPFLDDEQALLDLYARLDGLLLSGGGDISPRYFEQTRMAKLIEVDAPRDCTELLLARWAVRDNLPLLGICRGLQMLNVALGGTLYQDLGTQLPGAGRHRFAPGFARNYLSHEVRVVGDTLLASIVGTGRIPVNSFHHQAVHVVASRLRIAASAPDEVIEALEDPASRFVLGVQWHPEDLMAEDPRMLHLFEAFVAAAS